MAGHLRRLAQVASASLLTPEAHEQAHQPVPQRMPPQSASELAHFPRIADVAPCRRLVFVQRVGSFTNLTPVCLSHLWVGDVVSCEHEAARQVCTHRMHAQIAAARAERLQREGFVRFDGE